MACQPRKTEANREKERESQDEPIVNKSNAHGARGETSRGLVRSRVGYQPVRETRVRTCFVLESLDRRHVEMRESDFARPGEFLEWSLNLEPGNKPSNDSW